jgi:hypothetical protein
VVNIVLLTNEERLIRLFNNSAVQGTGKVRVAAGIHEALAAVTTKGQNLIFIQERLGEMAGELLAYRMSEELKGKKVRIILFGDPEAIPVSGRKPFQAVLDPALSDDDLSAVILEIVSTPAAGTRKKKAPVKNKPLPSAVERKPAESEPAILTETVDDVVKIQGAASYPLPAYSSDDIPPVSDLTRTTFQAKLESALNEASGSSTVPRREMPLVSPEPLRVTWGKPTFLERVRDRFRRPRILIIFGAACACFLALMFFLLFYQQKPGKTVGSSGSKPGTEENVVSPAFQNAPGALPSFLPRQSADSAYGKANPGWERYQGPLTEFRIFREKGLIRALQIIDRSGQGISPALLSSVLTEMAGGRQYVVETTEQKGSFIVEKGTVLNGDRIIVYRKEPERSVKAFVLDIK